MTLDMENLSVCKTQANPKIVLIRHSINNYFDSMLSCKSLTLTTDTKCLFIRIRFFRRLWKRVTFSVDRPLQLDPDLQKPLDRPLQLDPDLQKLLDRDQGDFSLLQKSLDRPRSGRLLAPRFQSLIFPLSVILSVYCHDEAVM